eukprot:TRINITY_DN50481_c0_g1_i1.p1 TRINITY_DN50481_c0_g1~~TRINITY_DN50481_c0_g1_i1.p1  ORF type:complete len:244 (+),score=107.12 TRINITY_DN50481_c0_g1_i1:48-734(+)
MAEPAAKRARTESKPVLFSYWRSSCSWRVRIALALKDVEYSYEAVNLLKGEQRSEDHVKRNVMGQVPAYIVSEGDDAVGQSLAIMEYIDEAHAGYPLLPKDLLQRAKVRELCNIIASGIQPIQNLAVLKKVGADFGDEHKTKWAQYWITEGFKALEKALERTAGKYCFGDEVTMADCCLVPQIYNAGRFNVDFSAFPLIKRIGEELDKHPAAKKAHPDNMPDAPKKEA